MQIEVVLSDYDMKLCGLFARFSARSQQRIEFGQKSTKEREFWEIARDNMIGKMGEVAVAQYLHKQFGLNVPVNFCIYPRGECDDIDIQIGEWGIDVKSTRYGKRLFYERSKLEYRRKSKTIPDALMMCRVPWDSERDEPESSTVKLIGCISLMNLINPNNPRVVLHEAGEWIPGTNTKLQADNYMVESENLYDIKESVEFMLKHRPLRKMAV